MKIYIKNFRQYNSRIDVRKNSWFRWQTDLITKPKYIKDLDKNCLCAWVYILSMASIEAKEEINVESHHVEYCGRITWEDFKISCEILQKLDFLEIERTHNAKLDFDRTTLHNITEHNITEHEELPSNKSRKNYDAIQELGSLLKFPEMLASVNPKIQKKWVKVFPMEMIIENLDKAALWLETNSHKAPKKNFAAFYTRWLVKAHEQYRRKLSPKEKSQFNPLARELDEHEKL